MGVFDRLGIRRANSSSLPTKINNSGIDERMMDAVYTAYLSDNHNVKGNEKDALYNWLIDDRNAEDLYWQKARDYFYVTGVDEKTGEKRYGASWGKVGLMYNGTQKGQMEDMEYNKAVDYINDAHNKSIGNPELDYIYNEKDMVYDPIMDVVYNKRFPQYGYRMVDNGDGNNSIPAMIRYEREEVNGNPGLGTPVLINQTDNTFGMFPKVRNAYDNKSGKYLGNGYDNYSDYQLDTKGGRVNGTYKTVTSSGNIAPSVNETEFIPATQPSIQPFSEPVVSTEPVVTPQQVENNVPPVSQSPVAGQLQMASTQPSPSQGNQPQQNDILDTTYLQSRQTPRLSNNLPTTYQGVPSAYNYVSNIANATTNPDSQSASPSAGLPMGTGAGQSDNDNVLPAKQASIQPLQATQMSGGTNSSTVTNNAPTMADNAVKRPRIGFDINNAQRQFSDTTGGVNSSDVFAGNDIINSPDDGFSGNMNYNAFKNIGSRIGSVFNRNRRRNVTDNLGSRQLSKDIIESGVLDASSDSFDEDKAMWGFNDTANKFASNNRNTLNQSGWTDKFQNTKFNNVANNFDLYGLGDKAVNSFNAYKNDNQYEKMGLSNDSSREHSLGAIFNAIGRKQNVNNTGAFERNRLDIGQQAFNSNQDVSNGWRQFNLGDYNKFSSEYSKSPFTHNFGKNFLANNQAAASGFLNGMKYSNGNLMAGIISGAASGLGDLADQTIFRKNSAKRLNNAINDAREIAYANNYSNLSHETNRYYNNKYMNDRIMSAYGGYIYER